MFKSVNKVDTWFQQLPNKNLEVTVRLADTEVHDFM